jgi:hypothetical protein
MPFELITSLRLSKDGYGTPKEVLEMPTELVLAALDYSCFLIDYQDALNKLNSNE